MERKGATSHRLEFRVRIDQPPQPPSSHQSIRRSHPSPPLQRLPFVSAAAAFDSIRARPHKLPKCSRDPSAGRAVSLDIRLRAQGVRPVQLLTPELLIGRRFLRGQRKRTIGTISLRKCSIAGLDFMYTGTSIRQRVCRRRWNWLWRVQIGSICWSCCRCILFALPVIKGGLVSVTIGRNAHYI